MIYGNGTLAEALRTYYGDVPFTWIAWDTPILADGRPDTKAVLDMAFEVLDHGLHDDVIISSQLPVGTCATFEERWPLRDFYVVPENVRAAHAFNDWTHQARIIVGARRNRFRLDSLWARITPEVIYVSPETAELTKHCLNGFLALSV
jgi:UDPglucose 6-dehydrogenase